MVVATIFQAYNPSSKYCAARRSLVAHQESGGGVSIQFSCVF
jgi:hypothetical protein